MKSALQIGSRLGSFRLRRGIAFLAEPTRLALNIAMALGPSMASTGTATFVYVGNSHSQNFG